MIAKVFLMLNILLSGPILLNERRHQNVTRWRGNYQIRILWYQVQSYWLKDGPRMRAHEEGITRSWDYGTIPWDYELLHLHILVAKGSPICVVDCFLQNIFPTLVHLIRSQYTLDQDMCMCCIFYKLAPRFYLDYN